MALLGVKIGMFVGLVALVTDIFALILPWWTYSEEERFGEFWKTNSGLWENCNHITDVFGQMQYRCSKLQEPEEYIRLTRNMCLAGLFFLIGGLFTTTVGRCILVDLHLLPLVGGLATILAGFLIWLAVLLFSENYVKTAGHEPLDVHASWGLGLTSAFLCFATSILCLWDRRKENTGSESKPEDERADSECHEKGAPWRTLRKDSWKPRYLNLSPRRSHGGNSVAPIDTISKSDLQSHRQ